jgi:mannose-1-phosphate guanylyltransferase
MKRNAAAGEVWAIVLAAGRGARLAAVTKALHGREVPKQFAALCGERTFVQRTMDRIGALVPPERTLVVVGDDQMELARAQLAEYPGVEIIRQPRNLGTAPGLLLPLAHLLARDAGARVVVFPSDHHFAREAAFVDAVRRAVDTAARTPGGVTLVGAEADSAAIDLGWIVRGARCRPRTARAYRVAGFVEKPPETIAVQLLGEQALWNTLIVAARARALWELAAWHVPEIVKALARYRLSIGLPGAQRQLRCIYAKLPAADLSRDILQPARGLSVVSMIDAGWSDCGTPERLFRAFGDLRPPDLGVVGLPLRKRQSLASRRHRQEQRHAPQA